MSMPRRIEPELLDGLTAGDARAIRARRDLRRVNFLMGHPLIWRKILSRSFAARIPPQNILEFGAGDGTLMLGLARSFAAAWPNVHVQLLDVQPAVSDRTLNGLNRLGWRTDVVRADALQWSESMPRVDLVIANLLLHHFENEKLRLLFQALSVHAGVFAACEPRRGSIGLLGSHMLGLAGCGPVARYDAVVSVRAGFAHRELTALWPARDRARLSEDSAGLFSHVFIAGGST